MAKTSDTSLFPILPQQPIGIARMAAAATHADDGHLIEFKALQVRSILNKSISKRQLSLAYSINPYRGCEFGCKYCYARYTHEFMAPKTDLRCERKQFEFACGELSRSACLRANDLPEAERGVAAGAGVEKDRSGDGDCAGNGDGPLSADRAAERRLPAACLEVFARKAGYRLGIVTKSRLIERDIDLLLEISRRNTLVVHVTITTPDAKLARLTGAAGAHGRIFAFRR